MYERATKGVKYQLTGLNNWVAALLIGFVLTIFMNSFFGFILAFIMFLFVLVGLLMFIIGLILILIGGKEVDNTSWAAASLILLILTPFVLMIGIFNVRPMNIIIIHLGLWMLGVSLVLPYLRMGGFITGMIAILIETSTLIYTMSVMLFSRMGVTMPLAMSLVGGYFLFLEFSIILSYLKLKRMKANLEVVEGEGKKTVEVGVTGKPVPAGQSNIQVKRSSRITFEPAAPAAAKNDPSSGFKVLEFEFSGSSRAGSPMDEKEIFKGIPTPDQEAKQTKAKEPVIGRVLKFEEAVKRAEAESRAKDKEPTQKEKYTVEDEEEIDISFDDLYLEGQTLYEILKLPSTASSDDIRKAYRKRALLYHPDKNRDMGPMYAETIGLEMRKLNTAKAILLDPAKRSIYDRMLMSVS